ncbi:MAG: hypothetical protein WCW64_00690 [Phycisphaerae bacterium]|jgi:hypothetical protein
MKKTQEKYKMEELKKFPSKARSLKVGLMIANELHNIHSVLKKCEELQNSKNRLK